MPYDKALDKEIHKETIEFDGYNINVSIYSYNDGPAKIQLGKETINPATGDARWAKLGRLSKEEAQRVIEAIGKCVEQMQ